MKNEYKANLCLHCLTDITRSCHDICGYYERYKAMQQKDREFKEYLEKKKRSYDFYSDIQSKYRSDAIQEIINELFGGE